jgi:hypothetical protein
MVGETIDTSRYGTWLSNLFPASGYLSIALVSGGVALSLFLVGYLLATVGALAYLSEPDGYLAAFAVFWTLTALGLANDAYVDVWNDVRPAFAVDNETYRAVVGTRLDRIYDRYRVLVYAAGLWIPFVIIVNAIYLPGSPFRDAAIDVFLANEPSPLPPRVLRVGLYYLLGAVNAVLIAAVLNGS